MDCRALASAARDSEACRKPRPAARCPIARYRRSSSRRRFPADLSTQHQRRSWLQTRGCQVAGAHCISCDFAVERASTGRRSCPWCRWRRAAWRPLSHRRNCCDVIGCRIGVRSRLRALGIRFGPETPETFSPEKQLVSWSACARCVLSSQAWTGGVFKEATAPSTFTCLFSLAEHRKGQKNHLIADRVDSGLRTRAATSAPATIFLAPVLNSTIWSTAY